MGAIIFIDYYLFPKMNLKTDYAEKMKVMFNWSAGLTWILTLIACLGLNIFYGIEIFFLGLPGWFVAAILYIVLAKGLHKKQLQPA